MPYYAEYTDTFGGVTNYGWVRRAVLDMPEHASWRSIMQAARKALNLTGVKGDITADFGDSRNWVPRGCCTILMVSWQDEESVLAYRDEVWSVVAGNIGTVYRGGERQARNFFREYAKKSRNGEGRLAGESVTLLRDDEPKKEYRGKNAD